MVVRPWTKAAVAVLAGSALLYGLPNAADPRLGADPIAGDAVFRAVSPWAKNGPTGEALKSVGLWQYWDMFAPNPSRTNLHVDGLVRRADGSTAVIDYPRMADLAIPARYPAERYRKWLERGSSPGYAYLWPALAQWIAQRADDPANPPVLVELRRHVAVVPPFGSGRPLPPPTVEVVYRHVVDPRRLAAWRAARGGASGR